MIKRAHIPWLLTCTLAGAQTTALRDHWIAIRSSRRFTRTGKPGPNQAVVIKGDRITGIGPAEKIKLPAGSEAIDLSRASVLPGLIDTHSDVFGNGPGFANHTSTVFLTRWPMLRQA